MKTIFFIISIHVLVMSSCNRNPSNHSLLINNVVKDNEDSFSSLSNIILFCKVQDESHIGVTDVSGIQKNYKNTHLTNQSSYQEYVNDILNWNIILETIDINEVFIPNDTITLYYNNHSFSDFLSKYCDKTKDGRYSVIANISHNSQLTIIFYLYRNNYYTIYDDYIGLYYSEEVNSLLTRFEKEEPLDSVSD